MNDEHKQRRKQQVVSVTLHGLLSTVHREYPTLTSPYTERRTSSATRAEDNVASKWERKSAKKTPSSRSKPASSDSSGSKAKETTADHRRLDSQQNRKRPRSDPTVSLCPFSFVSRQLTPSLTDGRIERTPKRSNRYSARRVSLHSLSISDLASMTNELEQEFGLGRTSRQTHLAHSCRDCLRRGKRPGR